MKNKNGTLQLRSKDFVFNLSGGKVGSKLLDSDAK